MIVPSNAAKFNSYTAVPAKKNENALSARRGREPSFIVMLLHVFN